jgi:UDP-N-acetylglucosamine:LPS N-acetylglucosamine transferase
MEDKDALEKLIPEVFDLLNNNELQNKLKQNISTLGILNADEIIANQILDIIK